MCVREGVRFVSLYWPDGGSSQVRTVRVRAHGIRHAARSVAHGAIAETGDARHPGGAVV